MLGLEQIQEFYQELPWAVLCCKPGTGEIFFANSACLHLLRAQKKEELPFKKVFEYLDASQQSALKEHYDHLDFTLSHPGLPLSLQLKAGVVEVQSEMRWISESEGQEAYVVFYWTDVTALNSVAPFVELSPQPLLQISFDGKVLYANQASTPVLLHLQVEVGEVVPEEWLEHIQFVKENSMARAVRIEEGSIFFEMTLAPGQRANAIDVFGRDISREMELEQEVLELARAETANAMITTYNHEINNPLTIAMGLVSLGSDALDEEKLKRVSDALVRIKDIVKKIEEVVSEDGVAYENYTEDTKMLKIKKEAS